METKTLPLTSQHILRSAFARKKGRNPSYSMRALARDLGLSPAYLSLVFQGRKRLTLKRAHDVAEILKMETGERSGFLRAVAMETLNRSRSADGTLPSANLALEAMNAPQDFEVPRGDPLNQYFQLGLDRFRVLAQWYHIPILDLSTTQDAQGDTTWIAKRMGISVLEAQDALERLVRLGLIEKHRGKWVKTQQKIFLPTQRSDPSTREFHRQMIEKAAAELDKTSDREYQARRIVGTTLSIDTDRLEEAKLLIQEFQDKIANLLSHGKVREVYQLNVQLFPLTHPIDT